jgi:hypothetical protein
MPAVAKLFEMYRYDFHEDTEIHVAESYAESELVRAGVSNRTPCSDQTRTHHADVES